MLYEVPILVSREQWNWSLNPGLFGLLRSVVDTATARDGGWCDIIGLSMPGWFTESQTTCTRQVRVVRLL